MKNQAKISVTAILCFGLATFVGCNKQPSVFEDPLIVRCANATIVDGNGVNLIATGRYKIASVQTYKVGDQSGFFPASWASSANNCVAFLDDSTNPRVLVNYFYAMGTDDIYLATAYRQDFLIMLDSTDVDTLLVDKAADGDAKIYFNGALQASVPALEKTPVELRLRK